MKLEFLPYETGVSSYMRLEFHPYETREEERGNRKRLYVCTGLLRADRPSQCCE